MREDKMNLVYDTDFWAFYNKNRKDFDRILTAATLKYANQVQIDDLKQDIIVRLYQSCQRGAFLKNYDAGRSRLNTYVTVNVQLIARHAYRAATYVNDYTWEDESHNKQRTKWVQLDSTNITQSEDDDSCLTVLSSDSSELSIESKDLLSTLLQDINKDLLQVFFLSLEGYTHAEIV
jgi:hypothetical protein